MTYPSYQPPRRTYHCASCHVEWEALEAAPCWLCGGEAASGFDTALPWTNRAAWLAGADEKESA